MKKSKFETKKDFLGLYMKGLRKGLTIHAEKQLEILDKYCLTVAHYLDTYIFFKKMQADIYRYIAEVQQMNSGSDAKEKAEEAYLEARELYRMMSDERVEKSGNADANIEHDKIEVLRLSINLNYAVFLYEMKDEKKLALRILVKELQDALDDFEKWEHSEEE